MTTFVKKSLVAVVAVMALAMSIAAPVSAGTLYDDYKYYKDGYVDSRGTFRPYDYNYYHKDGYRSDSFYGDYKTYNAAYSNYRYSRDRNYYGSKYSDYYNSYDEYLNDFNYAYGDYGYYYDYGYTNPYTYRANYNYDYTTSYNYGNYGYDYNYGCSSYDYDCTYHRELDKTGDYNYIQIAPERYVRSDYYNDYYASERDRYMNSYNYRYY